MLDLSDDVAKFLSFPGECRVGSHTKSYLQFTALRDCFVSSRFITEGM